MKSGLKKTLNVLRQRLILQGKTTAFFQARHFLENKNATNFNVKLATKNNFLQIKSIFIRPIHHKNIASENTKHSEFSTEAGSRFSLP
jgi:hypothetical protein